MREEYKDSIKEKRYTVPVTVQLLMVKENQILMMRRSNTGYEDGKYCLPGGHVEKAEEIKDAMIREAEEEIGIRIKKEDLEVYKVLHRKTEKGSYIDFILKTEKMGWRDSKQRKRKM